MPRWSYTILALLVVVTVDSNGEEPKMRMNRCGRKASTRGGFRLPWNSLALPETQRKFLSDYRRILGLARTKCRCASALVLCSLFVRLAAPQISQGVKSNVARPGSHQSSYLLVSMDDTVGTL